MTVGFDDEDDLNHPSFGRAIKKITTKTIEAVRSVFFTDRIFLILICVLIFFKRHLVVLIHPIIND